MSTTAPTREIAGVARSGPVPDATTGLGLVVLLAAFFVVTLDFFIVNVALPSMQADLTAGSGALTVWVAGYAIALGAFLVLGARLGDRLGRRRMFLWGLATFTLASAACGAAPDPTTLSVARIAQGLGAALLTPQVLGTLTATTEGEARVRVLTIYGLTAGLAAVSGQLLGGVLLDVDLFGLGWRACFLVNVPVGIVALVLAGRAVPETRAARRLSIDPSSVAMLALGLGLVVLPLAEGRERGWPLWCVVAMVAGVVLLLDFALRQRSLARGGAVDPLVDLAMLRDRTFGVGTVVCFVVQTGIASSFFVLALALQGGLGLDPLESGLVFTTLAVGYVASSMAAPALQARWGRGILLGGAAVSAVGEAALALTAGEVHAGGSAAALIPGLVVAGIGMGMVFAPSVSLALAETDGGRSGEASGVITTVQEIGGAVGVALLAIVFYGALGTGGDVAHAFAVASWCLVGQSVLVGLLALGLRRHRG
ncbi:MFS transporter [Patulibacter minatonensis]|uniref:MFS transporter n=1 Tax=Patulibacter minatonensis TaxID=298163 RepID=UPI0004ADE6C4|nr:MFS transporter [Patulibacter minatonensis]